MVKFAVISTQRTGSTLLIKLLDSHPQVLCAGEIFHPPSGSEHALSRYLGQSAGRRLRHQLLRGGLVSEFLDDFFGQPGFDAIGFKFMYSQARHLPRSYPSVLPYLHQHGIRIIHGTRRNKLRVYLSRLNSRSSGVYRTTTAVEAKAIHVPTNDLVREMRQLEAEDTAWKEKLSVLPYMQVDYESLVAHKEAEERRLLQFIEVDYQGALSSPFRKQANNSLPAVIANYAEVRQVLKDTEFAWCLEEEEGGSC